MKYRIFMLGAVLLIAVGSAAGQKAIPQSVSPIDLLKVNRALDELIHDVLRSGDLKTPDGREIVEQLKLGCVVHKTDLQNSKLAMELQVQARGLAWGKDAVTTLQFAMELDASDLRGRLHLRTDLCGLLRSVIEDKNGEPLNESLLGITSPEEQHVIDEFRADYRKSIRPDSKFADFLELFERTLGRIDPLVQARLQAETDDWTSRHNEAKARVLRYKADFRTRNKAKQDLDSAVAKLAEIEAFRVSFRELTRQVRDRPDPSELRLDLSKVADQPGAYSVLFHSAVLNQLDVLATAEGLQIDGEVLNLQVLQASFELIRPILIAELLALADPNQPEHQTVKREVKKWSRELLIGATGFLLQLEQ